MVSVANKLRKLVHRSTPPYNPYIADTILYYWPATTHYNCSKNRVKLNKNKHGTRNTQFKPQKLTICCIAPCDTSHPQLFACLQPSPPCRRRRRRRRPLWGNSQSVSQARAMQQPIYLAIHPCTSLRSIRTWPKAFASLSHHCREESVGISLSALKMPPQPNVGSLLR